MAIYWRRFFYALSIILNIADMSETAMTEESKGGNSSYALNPISRRYVLKTSDVYLRLLKSGVVNDPATLESLDLRKREASRARQRGLAESRRGEVVPAPVPVAPVPVVPAVPAKLSRAAVRRHVVELATDNVSTLCDLDERAMEKRLRELLLSAPRPTPLQRTPARRDTRYKHFAVTTSDDDDDEDTA